MAFFCPFRSLTDFSSPSLSLYGKQCELSLNHLLLFSMEERKSHRHEIKAWDIMTVFFCWTLSLNPEMDWNTSTETPSTGGKRKCMCMHTYTHTHTHVWGGLSACVCVHLRVKSSVLIFMVINSGRHLAAGTADQALIESKCVCWERGRVTWNGTNVFLIELRVYMRVCVLPLGQVKLGDACEPLN